MGKEKTHRANRRYKLLDLFCGACGAAVGYHRAGFDVVGVDIINNDHYPYTFIRADALEFDVSGYDVVHASPPCQAYSVAAAHSRAKGKQYPDLVAAVREKLTMSRAPFVIENVPGAPIRHDLMLCGTMFHLGVLRHRYFELSDVTIPQPIHPKHKPPIMVAARTGRSTKRGQYCSVAGNGGRGASCKLGDWKDAMQIDWMTRKEITQAIPPAYTEYIGKYLMLACERGHTSTPNAFSSAITTSTSLSPMP